jgi:hypothetical protein
MADIDQMLDHWDVAIDHWMGCSERFPIGMS